MKIVIKSTPDEVKRARKWWQDLEMQWKFAFNEVNFGKGPTIEPPSDDELMFMHLGIDTFRFAGPGAINPNMTTRVNNLSGLTPMYRIRYLSITNMDFTSLQELYYHKNIEHLFVYENKLTSLKGIENMSNLKDLYFQNNEVTDLLPLKGLTKLETIYAVKNKLTSFEGLTEKHADSIRKFYALPNDDIRDKHVIKLQNEVGIIARNG